MVIRKGIAVAGLAAGMLAPAASLAETVTHRPPCILGDYRVTSVQPYKVDVKAGKNTYRRLAGAQVHLDAQPGLTAEWLRTKLSEHKEAMRGPTYMKDCVLDMDQVWIRVDSTGTGFNVKFIAKNPHEAKEVLRRTQLQIG